MNILLAQLPTSHLGARELVYPLGLSRLAGLIPVEYNKYVLDMNIVSDPWSELKKNLEDITPHVVSLSLRNIDPLGGHQTSYFSSLKTAARMVHKLAPEAMILAGGPAFSLFAKRLMQEVDEIHCGLVGEGEAVFQNLLRSVQNSQKKYWAIPGLVWRDKNKILCNAAKSSVDLDDLPKIDVDSFNPKDYTKVNNYVAAIGIEGKRGCDLSCSYCVYPCIGGSKFRLRNPIKIVDEMEKLNKGHGIDLFHFTDSVLNRPLAHFKTLCEELIMRKLNLKWAGFFREDSFTDETAVLAKKAGLIACYFSGDALTDHGLNILEKKMTKDDILQASRITAKYNILTMCHFLVNLPFETGVHIEEAKDTMKIILNIHEAAGNLGAVIINNVRLYPEAPLTKMLLKEGLLSNNIDLLYPIYYNPPETSFVLHELETQCHMAGVLSRLNIN